jgi:hypothetical protein
MICVYIRIYKLNFSVYNNRSNNRLISISDAVLDALSNGVFKIKNRLDVIGENRVLPEISGMGTIIGSFRLFFLQQLRWKVAYRVEHKILSRLVYHEENLMWKWAHTRLQNKVVVQFWRSEKRHVVIVFLIKTEQSDGLTWNFF